MFRSYPRSARHGRRRHGKTLWSASWRNGQSERDKLFITSRKGQTARRRNSSWRFSAWISLSVSGLGSATTVCCTGLDLFAHDIPGRRNIDRRSHRRGHIADSRRLTDAAGPSLLATLANRLKDIRSVFLEREDIILSEHETDLLDGDLLSIRQGHHLHDQEHIGFIVVELSDADRYWRCLPATAGCRAELLADRFHTSTLWTPPTLIQKTDSSTGGARLVWLVQSAVPRSPVWSSGNV